MYTSTGTREKEGPRQVALYLPQCPTDDDIHIYMPIIVRRSFQASEPMSVICCSPDKGLLSQ